MTRLEITDMVNSVGFDPKHPGLHDEDYVRRRYAFFEKSKQYRLENRGLPHFDYLPSEHELWQKIFSQLLIRQNQDACRIYLEGREKLGLTAAEFPQVQVLSSRLQENSGFELGPAEGLLNVRDFFGYIAQRKMPCTQFLRHPTHPEYTPEPDAVHDVIGHVPQLIDAEYADLIQTIAQGIEQTSDDQLTAWERIYWFTIEFGLIQEQGELKAFGAGLLSSYGELAYSLSSEVKKHPLSIEKIIATDYDSTKMQDLLFVIPSLAALKQAIIDYIEETT